MPTLQFLDLSDNLITGNLSQACGLAKSGFVEQIAVAGNDISGSIPSCIAGLKNLIELRLDNNRLSGTVPRSTAAKSSKLVYFTAANQARLALPLVEPALYTKFRRCLHRSISISVRTNKGMSALVHHWVAKQGH